MNLRNHSTDELLNVALYSFANQEAACKEFIRRIDNDNIIDPPSQFDVDEHDEEIHEQGADEGQRCERDEMKMWIANQLTFVYKDKIEAKVLDQLLTDINDEFPDLERRKE